MKNRLYIIWAMIAFSAVFFLACKQDGWDREELYIGGSFKSVNNVNGIGGFGCAMFSWDLPDSTSTLNMIEMTWVSDSTEGTRFFSKYVDSVCISDLKEANYTFEIISLGENGEKEITQMKCEVIDQKKELAMNVENFSAIPAINFLFLDWDHPNDPNYSGVGFEISRIENTDTILDREIFVSKDELAKFEFVLEPLTQYALEYYSVNRLGSHSASSKFFFQTRAIAPEVAKISIDSTNIGIYEFCHGAEIKWTPTTDMDSILIKFIGMDGEEYSYQFGGDKGCLAPLPGGTAKLSVQVRGTNGTWSLSESQEIKTKLTEEITTLDYSTDKLTGRCIGEALGYGSAASKVYDYTFQELAGLKKLKLLYTLREINEVELCVNLEELDLFGRESYNPIGLTIDDYRRMVSRLVKLRIITVNKYWPLNQEIIKEFEDHPRVKVIFK